MRRILRFAYLNAFLTHTLSLDATPTTCRVLQAFIYERQNISSEEQQILEKDRFMTEFVLTHPKETLWNYFKLKSRRNFEYYGSLSLLKKLSHTVTNTLESIVSTSMDGISYALRAFQWILLTFHHPSIGISDVRVFFRDLRDNCVSLYHTMHHNATTDTLAGGFLLHIVRHPEQFTANSVLMVSGGFAVVNGLIAGAQMLFQELNSSTIRVLMSVLLFMHTVNDPTILIVPLLDRFTKADANVIDRKASEERVFRTLRPLDDCDIPPQHSHNLTTSDLCLTRPKNVRMILFGSTKRLHTMSQVERTSAYNHMHNLVCCYLKDFSFEIDVPELIDGFPTGRLVRKPVSMNKCDQKAEKLPVASHVSKSRQTVVVESSYLRVVS
ncbi:unnamed protein product [Albugo candida]|uniref:Uncharacterized protein n=1 Tax=Albugo candida TaxID=65357 RepID=A0A024GGW0_9STRA|nr:unnamed protein product [Albugo candida]|eukprot:CCI46132.1 unnamed protein product [Albugo candida]